MPVIHRLRNHKMLKAQFWNFLKSVLHSVVEMSVKYDDKFKSSTKSQLNEHYHLRADDNKLKYKITFSQH